jgi:hypothetical protein
VICARVAERSDPRDSPERPGAIRYYQRRLIEGGDPSELREARAARRDRVLAQLFDAATELHELHEVSAEELVEFIHTVLGSPGGVDVGA